MTSNTTAKLIVLNVCWIAGVTWATAMGYTAFVFAGDKSLVSYPIAAIAVASAAASFWGGKYLMRAAWLCSCLGFLGTLIGIMAGMSSAHDLTSTAGLVATGAALFAGVGTAFSSTIVGTFGMLWIWSIAQVRGDDWQVV